MKSDEGTLGRLTRSPANYWAGFVLDTGAAVGLVAGGWAAHEGAALEPGVALAAGGVSYSFYEYAFHRWLYHGASSSFRTLHRLHHASPSATIGAPFFFSLAVIGATWALARLFVPTSLAAVFAGSHLAGYAVQGMVHHAIHRMRPADRGWLERLRAHHLLHHRREDGNFGVTSALWDRLLGTRLR